MASLGSRPRAFTASLPATHHLRERVAADEQDQLDLYELRHFGASYMLNELELYEHPDRNRAIDRIRRAYAEPTLARVRGTASTLSPAHTGRFGGRP